MFDSAVLAFECRGFVLVSAITFAAIAGHQLWLGVRAHIAVRARGRRTHMFLAYNRRCEERLAYMFLTYKYTRERMSTSAMLTSTNTPTHSRPAVRVRVYRGRPHEGSQPQAVDAEGPEVAGLCPGKAGVCV